MIKIILHRILHEQIARFQIWRNLSVHFVKSNVQENVHPNNTAHPRTSEKVRHLAGLWCLECILTVEWYNFSTWPGIYPGDTFFSEKRRAYNIFAHNSTPNIYLRPFPLIFNHLILFALYSIIMSSNFPLRRKVASPPNQIHCRNIGTFSWFLHV